MVTIKNKPHTSSGKCNKCQEGFFSYPKVLEIPDQHQRIEKNIIKLNIDKTIPVNFKPLNILFFIYIILSFYKF